MVRVSGKLSASDLWKVEQTFTRALEIPLSFLQPKRMEGFEGMARLHTKPVEEMAIAKEEARTNAQAADKGEVTTNA